MSAALEKRVSDLEEQMATLIAGRPRRVYMSDVIRFQLPKQLPDLMRRHPNGVTTQIVADHFGIPWASTMQAISALVKAGKVVRHRHAGSNATVIVPAGVAPPPAPLTKQRKRVLEAMIRLSSAGRLEMSMLTISREIGTTPSTLAYVIASLLASRHVKLISAGRNGKPSVYFIPSAIQ